MTVLCRQKIFMSVPITFLEVLDLGLRERGAGEVAGGVG